MLASVLTAAAILVKSDPTAPPADPQPIIVEGKRLPDQKEALRTVTNMTMIVESQIPRFHDPVCPLVLGLKAEAGVIVEQRIRELAKEVGAPVHAGKCEGNLILFVTSDSPGLINDLEKQRPRWFENVPTSEIRRALREAPVRGWSATSVRNEKGDKPSGRAVTDQDSFRGFTTARGWVAPVLRVSRASMLQNVSRYHIDGSVIIVDADAIEGFTLRQLGDYAAMRGLAKVRPPENVSQFNSILSIFSTTKLSAPRELTPFDHRYLTQLYKGQGYDRSVFERQRLAKAIAGDR